MEGLSQKGPEVSKLHAYRLGRVAEGRRLEQHYIDLQRRFNALPPTMRGPYRPELLEHSTKCSKELTNNPKAQLPYHFHWLSETYKAVYFAIVNVDLDAARQGLERAEIRMREAKQVFEAANTSLLFLEKCHREFTIKTKCVALLDQLPKFNTEYSHILQQWQSIDLAIRIYAVGISMEAKQLCTAAFMPRRGVVPQFHSMKTALDRSVQIVFQSLLNANGNFSSTETSLAAANRQCDSIQIYLLRLHTAVQEYKAAELRMRELGDEVEKAKSVDRIFDWLDDVELPKDRTQATSRPDSAFYSGSQTGFDSFANQRSGSIRRGQFIDQRTAQVESSQVEQPPMNGVSRNSGWTAQVRSGEFKEFVPFRGFPGQFRSVQQHTASSNNLNSSGAFGRLHQPEAPFSTSYFAQR